MNMLRHWICKLLRTPLRQSDAAGRQRDRGGASRWLVARRMRRVCAVECLETRALLSTSGLIATVPSSLIISVPELTTPAGQVGETVTVHSANELVTVERSPFGERPAPHASALVGSALQPQRMLSLGALTASPTVQQSHRTGQETRPTSTGFPLPALHGESSTTGLQQLARDVLVASDTPHDSARLSESLWSADLAAKPDAQARELQPVSLPSNAQSVPFACALGLCPEPRVDLAEFRGDLNGDRAGLVAARIQLPFGAGIRNADGQFGFAQFGGQFDAAIGSLISRLPPLPFAIHERLASAAAAFDVVGDETATGRSATQFAPAPAAIIQGELRARANTLVFELSRSTAPISTNSPDPISFASLALDAGVGTRRPDDASSVASVAFTDSHAADPARTGHSSRYSDQLSSGFVESDGLIELEPGLGMTRGRGRNELRNSATSNGAVTNDAGRHSTLDALPELNRQILRELLRPGREREARTDEGANYRAASPSPPDDSTDGMIELVAANVSRFAPLRAASDDPHRGRHSLRESTTATIHVDAGVGIYQAFEMAYLADDAAGTENFLSARHAPLPSSDLPGEASHEAEGETETATDKSSLPTALFATSVLFVGFVSQTWLKEGRSHPLVVNGPTERRNDDGSVV